MRQSEHVLYITLVDFLLQLIFLALVISVIHTAQQPDPVGVKENEVFISKVKTLTGISDLTILTDELTRLGPLQQAVADKKAAGELDELIKKIGGKEKALKLINDEVKKAGQGLPSCMANSEKIAVFDAYTDRIEIQQPLSKQLIELLGELKISADKLAKPTLDEFRNAMLPLANRNQRENCIFNVTVIEHSYDTRPRDKFRGIFSISSRSAQGIK
jgi:hypothetical protein